MKQINQCLAEYEDFTFTNQKIGIIRVIKKKKVRRFSLAKPSE